MIYLTENGIQEARSEIAEKGHAQIELETAIKWGSRAVACFSLYMQTHQPDWRDLAVVYAHEALEHAAGASPEALANLRAELQRVCPQLIFG
jgi:hypothetical protein